MSADYFSRWVDENIPDGSDMLEEYLAFDDFSYQTDPYADIMNHQVPTDDGLQGKKIVVSVDPPPKDIDPDVIYIRLNKYSYVLDYVPPTNEWREKCAKLFGLKIGKVQYSQKREISVHYFPEQNAANRIVRMSGDGNCLFRALAFLITSKRSATDHKNVRKAICDFLMANADVAKVRNIVCMNVAEYLQKDKGAIMRPATSKEQVKRYGTDKEINIFAEMTNCLIYVWNPYFYSSKNLRTTWKCFGTRTNRSIPALNQAEIDLEKPTFFLEFKDNTHFNVVLM